VTLCTNIPFVAPLQNLAVDSRSCEVQIVVEDSERVVDSYAEVEVVRLARR